MVSCGNGLGNRLDCYKRHLSIGRVLVMHNNIPKLDNKSNTMILLYIIHLLILIFIAFVLTQIDKKLSNG